MNTIMMYLLPLEFLIGLLLECIYLLTVLVMLLKQLMNILIFDPISLSIHDPSTNRFLEQLLSY